MKNKAFTLIELLVVMAIMAILAAILFPVFAQVRTSAKKVNDLSNMKQLGVAMQLYSGDNDDLTLVKDEDEGLSNCFEKSTKICENVEIFLSNHIGVCRVCP